MSTANYRNDSLIMGFSNLRRLRTERPLVMARGQGVFLFDEDGRDYIDGVASFYCAALGYSEGELIEAAMRQFKELPFYTTGVHRTVPVVMELADRLAAIAPIPNAKVAFATTGSEANDNLIKFAWYRNVFRDQPKRRKIISRRSSYHGSTIATSMLGGAKDLHDSFALPMADSLLVSQPDFARTALPGEDEAAFVARLAAELETTIIEAGPETVAAFIAEPLSFSAGMIPPPKGYFAAMTAVLDRYGIDFFADEVITGFGRTGEFWGSTALGLNPQAITSAKGLTGAYQPISAVVMSEAFYDGLERGSEAKGWFAHSGTYHAHPVAAAVALEMLDIMERRDILGHVQAIMPIFHQAIERCRAHPLIARTRAFGLAGAIDAADPFAAPAAASAPGGMKLGGLGKAIYEAGLEHGVIFRPLGDGIVIAPPLSITAAETGEMFDRLTAALDHVLAGLKPA